MRIGFSFGFHPNGLDLFYNRNLFGYATFKGDFSVLDLDDNYDNTFSYFDFDSKSIKQNTRLGHVG